MRKQYHFHKSGEDILIWDIDNLIDLSKKFQPMEVLLSDIKELDECFWFGMEGNKPSCKKVAGHAKLINEVDMQYPIILSSTGRVMDGMHRVCRAYLENNEVVKAVKFEIDPKPDYINVDEDDLTY